MATESLRTPQTASMTTECLQPPCGPDESTRRSSPGRQSDCDKNSDFVLDINTRPAIIYWLDSDKQASFWDVRARLYVNVLEKQAVFRLRLRSTKSDAFYLFISPEDLSSVREVSLPCHTINQTPAEHYTTLEFNMTRRPSLVGRGDAPVEVEDASRLLAFAAQLQFTLCFQNSSITDTVQTQLKTLPAVMSTHKLKLDAQRADIHSLFTGRGGLALEWEVLEEVLAAVSSETSLREKQDSSKQHPPMQHPSKQPRIKQSLPKQPPYEDASSSASVSLSGAHKRRRIDEPQPAFLPPYTPRRSNTAVEDKFEKEQDIFKKEVISQVQQMLDKAALDDAKRLDKLRSEVIGDSRKTLASEIGSKIDDTFERHVRAVAEGEVQSTTREMVRREARLTVRQMAEAEVQSITRETVPREARLAVRQMAEEEVQLLTREIVPPEVRLTIREMVLREVKVQVREMVKQELRSQITEMAKGMEVEAAGQQVNVKRVRLA
ncbi:hypothetical protein QBC43DRAFT_292094 [Cladorrhinum sp. PSN259]|nr:hypothetical protein QBC43DRAFT_292094 [Cladorrhinum sp. PSN259]